MSRPRLHSALLNLFESKGPELLQGVLNHPDFQLFQTAHGLKLPAAQLAQAFTHTSFTHEFMAPNQELLEFLGDSVLQLILTEELCRLYPAQKEGQLSKHRSAIVNEKSLALVARSLQLTDLLIVGKGEFSKGLHQQESVLADTLEALLGVIYLHHGLKTVREIFLGWLAVSSPTALTQEFLEDFDAKSKLQELTMAKFKNLPRYCAEASGEKFRIGLMINDVEILNGVYPSKKAGEKDLAFRALKEKLI
jgi:ribonuclease III